MIRFSLALLVSCLSTVCAFADAMIDQEGLLRVLPEMVAEKNCDESCAAGNFLFRPAKLPPDISVGSRRAFIVWHPTGGSAGFPAAAVAVGDDGVFYLGDGFNLNEESIGIRPVSDATRIADKPKGIGSIPVENAGSPGDAAMEFSGALCRRARPPLSQESLGELLWGAKVEGTSAKGTLWTEYMARDNRTIIVGASGIPTEGRYRIEGDQVCFSYGERQTWSCKRISVCISGEAAYVITDLAGNQTSLITYTEMYGAAPFHLNYWKSGRAQTAGKTAATGSAPPPASFAPAELPSAAGPTVESCAAIKEAQVRLECFDAAFRAGAGAGSREVAPPTSFSSSDANALGSILMSGFQGVGIDLEGCRMTSVQTFEIATVTSGSFIEGGGFKGWLGDSTPKKRTVTGSREVTSLIPVGSLDTNRFHIRDNKLTVAIRPGGNVILSTAIDTEAGTKKTLYANRAEQEYDFAFKPGGDAGPKMNSALSLLRAFVEQCR